MFISQYRSVFSWGENNKEKWLLWCSYNSHKALTGNEKHMNKLGKSFDIYVQKYDHLLLIGYFNLEISEDQFMISVMSII